MLSSPQSLRHLRFLGLPDAHTYWCMCPFSQAAVYLARSNRVPARRLLPRTLLSPARRLARTTISLGPEAGIIFGLRALR